jgi:hypothetical protein
MSDPPIRLRKPPKPRKQGPGCVALFLITVVGGVIIFGLGALWSSWKTTFDECAKTETELRAEYIGLTWEIYAREAKITAEVGQSKTIDDLKTLLKEPYYNNSKYKDKSLGELRVQFTVNQDRLRIVEKNETYEKDTKKLYESINQLPRVAELSEVITYGTVPNTLHDNDLKDLIVATLAIRNKDALTFFLNPFRTYYEETCTYQNVTLNWLDLNELVYRGTLRTFSDAVRQQTDWLKAHPESN